MDHSVDFAICECSFTSTASKTDVIIKITIRLDYFPSIDDLLAAVRAGKFDVCAHDSIPSEGKLMLTSINMRQRTNCSPVQVTRGPMDTLP